VSDCVAKGAHPFVILDARRGLHPRRHIHDVGTERRDRKHDILRAQSTSEDDLDAAAQSTDVAGKLSPRERYPGSTQCAPPNVRVEQNGVGTDSIRRQVRWKPFGVDADNAPDLTGENLTDCFDLVGCRGAVELYDIQLEMLGNSGDLGCRLIGEDTDPAYVVGNVRKNLLRCFRR
jgi:hypothetical protein